MSRHLLDVTALFSFTMLVLACDSPPHTSSRNDSSVVVTAATPAAVPGTPQGGFAFANADGTQLLALDSLAVPSAIRGALCSRGVVLTVRYDHRATRQPADNGRQVAANFANQQGDVFRVGGTATPDQTCYLSSDSLLLSSAHAALMRKPAECSSDEIARVGAAKHRQVTHCWEIATAPANLNLLAVQFADIDTAALASLIVLRDSTLFFKDFPAVRHGGDESTWRVDDGGVFSPEGFDVPFVAQVPAGFVIAITWAGAEGETSELLLADSTGNLRTLNKAYRYWSPS